MMTVAARVLVGDDGLVDDIGCLFLVFVYYDDSGAGALFDYYVSYVFTSLGFFV